MKTAVVTAATVAAWVLLGGCAQTGGVVGRVGAAVGMGEPKTAEAAQAMLDKAVGRSIAGDNGGEWDLFIAADQRLISREEYVAYQTKCGDKSLQGVPYQLTDVHLDGGDQNAVGTVKIMGVSVLVHAYYENGAWHTTMQDANRSGAQRWAASKTCAPKTS